jgi:hypothetical protein
MTVKSTLNAALQTQVDRTAVQEAELWLARVETLLDWIARHPKLVEIRFEAGRLLSDYRGEYPIELEPNRKV